MIKSLSSASIHRICSSQVITSLGTAVKELVENSLDANANKIEIILKNYGKETITVSDNGTGIDSKDFALIAKKHATSKIEQFKDLESLQSFGFRGEALSSLCAICGKELVITTKLKTASTPFGYELHYDREGELIKNKKIAFSKPHGTSIVISQLFKTLPVRYKDFTKNIKKEYSNLLSILQSYAIIQTDVCFIVKNDNKMVINTSNNSKKNSVRNNIGNIFGWKLIEKLTKIDNKCIELQDNTSVTLNGFISNELMECGRTKNDIQFFYVNKRPIDINKIQKMINQIYKSNINRHKYPIVVLNLQLLTDKYDVNIDPNKRTVFIQNEKTLIEKLREFFEKLYEPSNMSYNVKSLDSFIKTQNTSQIIHDAQDEESDDQVNVNTNNAGNRNNYNNRNNRKRKYFERDDDNNEPEKSPTSEDFKEPPNKFRRGTQSQKIATITTNTVNSNNYSIDPMDEDDDEETVSEIEMDKQETLTQFFQREPSPNDNKPLKRRSSPRRSSPSRKQYSQRNQSSMSVSPSPPNILKKEKMNELESGIYQQDEISLQISLVFVFILY